MWRKNTKICKAHTFSESRFSHIYFSDIVIWVSFISRPNSPLGGVTNRQILCAADKETNRQTEVDKQRPGSESDTGQKLPGEAVFELVATYIGVI